jgi:5-methylcytosine-specific restriction endonuclease McrA
MALLSDAGSTRAWRIVRQWILQRDQHVCWLCGRKGANSVDHVVPRERGGTDELGNLRAAHASCNSRRGARTPVAPATSRTW